MTDDRELKRAAAQRARENLQQTKADIDRLFTKLETAGTQTRRQLLTLLQTNVQGVYQLALEVLDALTEGS